MLSYERLKTYFQTNAQKIAPFQDFFRSWSSNNSKTTWKTAIVWNAQQLEQLEQLLEHVLWTKNTFIKRAVPVVPRLRIPRSLIKVFMKRKFLLHDVKEILKL